LTNKKPFYLLPAQTGTGGFTVNKKHDSADSDKFYFVSFVITKQIDLIV